MTIYIKKREITEIWFKDGKFFKYGSCIIFSLGYDKYKI